MISYILKNLEGRGLIEHLTSLIAMIMALLLLCEKYFAMKRDARDLARRVIIGITCRCESDPDLSLFLEETSVRRALSLKEVGLIDKNEIVILIEPRLFESLSCDFCVSRSDEKRFYLTRHLKTNGNRELIHLLTSVKRSMMRDIRE